MYKRKVRDAAVIGIKMPSMVGASYRPELSARIWKIPLSCAEIGQTVSKSTWI